MRQTGSTNEHIRSRRAIKLGGEVVAPHVQDGDLQVTTCERLTPTSRTLSANG